MNSAPVSSESRIAGDAVRGSVVHTGRMVSSAAERHPLASVLDPLLLEVLACPAPHHAPLVPGEPGNPLSLSLTCTECGRIFDVRDGIPVLLLDEARFPGDSAPSTPSTPSTPSVASRPTGAGS